MPLFVVVPPLAIPAYPERVRYLSDEWFAAANAAVRDAAATAPAGPVIVDQHVTDDDPITWRVAINTGAASIRVIAAGDDGDDLAPHATFRQTRATARAVATGERDAHQAFLLGEIEFEGDINVLVERRAALDWLAETLAPVLAATDF